MVNCLDYSKAEMCNQMIESYIFFKIICFMMKKEGETVLTNESIIWWVHGT